MSANHSVQGELLLLAFPRQEGVGNGSLCGPDTPPVIAGMHLPKPKAFVEMGAYTLLSLHHDSYSKKYRPNDQL